MKLISMTDFVLEKQRFKEDSDTAIFKITNYANFLKHPLKLEMFVPCDEDGNVLEEPSKKIYLASISYAQLINSDLVQYQQAKEKVLFEGFENYFFELKEHDVFVLNEKIFSTKDLVENLLEYKVLEFNLTPNAIKRIFG